MWGVFNEGERGRKKRPGNVFLWNHFGLSERGHLWQLAAARRRNLGGREAMRRQEKTPGAVNAPGFFAKEPGRFFKRPGWN